MDDYKISLGVKLDTSDIQTQINEAGRNAKPIEIKVDTEAKELTKSIKEALNSLSKGTKNALTLDTTALESSLKEVKNAVVDIRNAFGTIDDKSGIRSLLSSVNQIATTIGKVTDETDTLVKSLSALSKKDFSFNVDLKLGGGSNSFSNTAAYGDYVRRTAIPELRSQAESMMKAIREQYTEFFSWQSDEFVLDTLSKRKSYSPIRSVGLLQKEMADGRNLSKQMAAYNEYINLVEEVGRLSGVDMGGITAGFSRTKDEIIQNAFDIQSGVKKATEGTEESAKKLKNIFGGGIDADALTAQLTPIVEKLEEIRVAVESLSKGVSIDGLTQSFDRLSETLEKLMTNAKLVQDVLGNSFSNANINTGAVDNVEKISDASTATVIQNEKKKQEAYKATADAVVYHAGVVSRLNKAETNGRFWGSERGTGYYGTGHYFVDSATKHELDGSDSYGKLPYTSVDISKYDNLFRASTDEVAGRLHDFLKNLTLFTQGSERYDMSELFVQFKNVFGDTIMDVQEFGSRLDQLKTFMTNSSLGDRSDSVSTQFMKSLGYEGVDTRGTRYANTTYGTVIYDLKEESILQANITDELQKRGQMLEKINYANGQAFDSDIDSKIQRQLDAQIKQEEVAEEFKRSFDTTNLDKADDDLVNAKNRIEEIDGALHSLQNSLNNLDREYNNSIKEMKSLGFDDDDLLLLYDEEEWKRDHAEIYQSSIDKLSKEKAELQSKMPSLEEAYNRENQLAQEAYRQAQQVVEQRHLESQQAQETANDVVQAEERKQQAIKETQMLISDSAQKAIDNVSSKSIDSAFKVDESDSLAFRREIENLVSQWTNAKGELTDIKIDTSTVYDADTERHIEQITKAQVTYNNELGETIKKTIALKQIGMETKVVDGTETTSPIYGFAEVSGQYSKSLGKTKAQTDAFVKQQKQAVANLTNQINQLNRAASDQNAARPIKDVAHLDTLKTKYNEITTAIQKMEAASSDTFVDEQNNVKSLISDFKSLVSEYKNAENVSSKMKGTDFASGFNIAKNDLEKFKAEAKDFPQIAKTIESLDVAISGVGDASSLNKFNDQLRVARSELAKIKSETSASNRSEKVGINVSGLESKIADLKRISPEIDRFETEIDGAKVSVQSLLNDLKQVNTQGDFSVVNSKFRAFTDAAKAAGIAVKETVVNAKTVENIKFRLNDTGADSFKVEIKNIKDEVSQLKAVTPALSTALGQLDAAMKAMDVADEANDVQRLTIAYGEYEQALKKVQSQLKLSQQAERDDLNADKLEQAKKSLSLQMDNWLRDNSVAAKEFGKTIRELQARIDACDNASLKNLKAEFQNVTKEAKRAGATGKTFVDGLKSQFSKYSQYFSIASVFMYVEQGLRDMFEQVKLIDSAMTELKKVTDETDAAYNQFLTNAASRSKEIGTTIDGLVGSTADFARLGYGFKDAQGLAEVANIYAVVGDEINGVEGATESLISTMAAFKQTQANMSNSEFAMDIVDKFNEVDILAS